MKKFFSMMAAVAAMFVFASCGNDPVEGENKPATKTQLETPVVTVKEKGETSFTIEWEAVDNATSYMIFLDKNNKPTTAETSYTFTNLNAGTYTPRVKAIAEGYKDSEYSSVVEIVLTGLTSADWFTQTLSLPEVDETVDYGNDQVVVYQPYNGVKALWKGTGVADIKFALFETAGIDGVSDDQIKGKMNTFDNLAGALESINSEEGLEIIYGGCSANTSYTAYVLVENEAGQEFFTSNEITTSDFDVPAETQAWIGTWNAKTSQVITIDDEGKGVLSDKENSFTLTIAASATAPDMVVIDGLSVLGADNPTVGYVVENTLTISTNFSIGADASGVTYMWLPFVAVDGQLLGLNNFGSEVPAHTLTMAEDGTVTGETGKFGVRFNDGTEAEAEVVCTELYGVNEGGQLLFFIEAFPAVYRAGAMEVTKAATPTAKVLNKEARNFPMSLSSVVF